jgi:hypothetical protein
LIPGGAETLAWLAAVLQGVNTFLVSLQKASAYRSAWRTLKFALIEYHSEGGADSKPVKQAIKAGWEMIDKGYSIEKPSL